MHCAAMYWCAVVLWSSRSCVVREEDVEGDGVSEELDFVCITVQNAKEILRYLHFVRKCCDIVLKLLVLWGENNFQIAVNPKVIRVEPLCFFLTAIFPTRGG